MNAALARVFGLERFVVARWRVPAGASLRSSVSAADSEMIFNQYVRAAEGR